MSEKTQQIYELIENLFCLQRQTNAMAKNLEPHFVRDLDEIAFQMEQNLKNLTFLFGLLYSYNGKSTSAAKNRRAEKTEKKAAVRKRVLLLHTIVDCIVFRKNSQHKLVPHFRTHFVLHPSSLSLRFCGGPRCGCFIQTQIFAAKTRNSDRTL